MIDETKFLHVLVVRLYLGPKSETPRRLAYRKVGAFGGRPRQFSNLSDYSQLSIANGDILVPRIDPRNVLFFLLWLFLCFLAFFFSAHHTGPHALTHRGHTT